MKSLLVLSVLCFACMADVVELTPVQDAYICDCLPDVTNPNGGPTHIYFGRYGSCYDRTLIEWDLSQIPPGSTVQSAQMMLYCLSFYGTPSGQPVFYLIDEAWSGDTVTYNTQPAYGTSPSITGSWPSAQSWHQTDVTAFVQAWVEGSHPNHGIYCTSTGTTGSSVPGFWSSDSPDESLWPVLVVTWSGADLADGTWAAIKASE